MTLSAAEESLELLALAVEPEEVALLVELLVLEALVPVLVPVEVPVEVTDAADPDADEMSVTLAVVSVL